MSHGTGAVPANRRAADWRTRAACTTDPDAMFPSSNPAEIETAKSYCRRCPSIDLCLQWALNTGQEYGVWGGLSEGERRALRRRRRTAAPISIDDYTGTPRTLAPGRTLEEAWTASTEANGDHLMWVGPKVVYRVNRNITPNRLAFYLDRGRWPDGDVKRMCPVEGCVLPAHLADRRERAEAKDLAAAA